MAEVKRLYAGSPGISNGTLFTATTGRKTVIKEIVICNTNAAAKHITLKTGTATSGIPILSSRVIPANDVVILALSTVLDAGQVLEGQQETASAISITVSGHEI